MIKKAANVVEDCYCVDGHSVIEIDLTDEDDQSIAKERHVPPSKYRKFNNERPPLSIVSEDEMYVITEELGQTKISNGESDCIDLTSDNEEQNGFSEESLVNISDVVEFNNDYSRDELNASLCSDPDVIVDFDSADSVTCTEKESPHKSSSDNDFLKTESRIKKFFRIKTEIIEEKSNFFDDSDELPDIEIIDVKAGARQDEPSNSLEDVKPRLFTNLARTAENVSTDEDANAIKSSKLKMDFSDDSHLENELPSFEKIMSGQLDKRFHEEDNKMSSVSLYEFKSMCAKRQLGPLLSTCYSSDPSVVKYPFHENYRTVIEGCIEEHNQFKNINLLRKICDDIYSYTTSEQYAPVDIMEFLINHLLDGTNNSEQLGYIKRTLIHIHRLHAVLMLQLPIDRYLTAIQENTEKVFHSERKMDGQARTNFNANVFLLELLVSTFVQEFITSSKMANTVLNKLYSVEDNFSNVKNIMIWMMSLMQHEDPHAMLIQNQLLKILNLSTFVHQVPCHAATKIAEYLKSQIYSNLTSSDQRLKFIKSLNSLVKFKFLEYLLDDELSDAMHQGKISCTNIHENGQRPTVMPFTVGKYTKYYLPFSSWTSVSMIDEVYVKLNVLASVLYCYVKTQSCRGPSQFNMRNCKKYSESVSSLSSEDKLSLVTLKTQVERLKNSVESAYPEARCHLKIQACFMQIEMWSCLVSKSWTR